jgi:Cytochrome b(C-terminal)/b6/petD
MHGSEKDFLYHISGFLGAYYLVLASINAVAAFYLWHYKHRNTAAIAWTAFSGFMVLMAPLAMSGSPVGLPEWLKLAVNDATGPVAYSVGTTSILAVLFIFRRFFVNPMVAWIGFNASLLFMGLAMADPNFASIVTKADNVPIVGLVFLLGFFTWLATAKAVENDDRIARGLPPTEKLDDEKVLVWPDLVYTEMICMVALTALLLFWAIGLQAPLEEPASSVKTPNPSKAPWYFLGLQEMLVYYDPWNAGVVLPSLVIFGLMAIPFLDFNKKGNGYYTIEERKFSYLIFQFGFLELWITLIILGTFFRGPNWNIFGPFEFWDPHKVLALNNVDLSQYFWVIGLGRSLPRAPAGSGTWIEIGWILVRESPGILLTLGYFILLPPIMALTIFRSFFVKMGFLRYMIMANLLLFMASLPIKMVLRWIFNLKYIISIPEFFLNF